MWFIYAIITLLLWSIADLFYKKGAKEDDKYSHLKTGIMVGLAMGIHATLYLITQGVNFQIIDIIKYLPVSFFYIASMIIGYKGLRYIELSISSPIQNSSGIVASLLLFIIFKDELSTLDMIGIVIIGIGVILLSYLEGKKEAKETPKGKLGKKVIFLAIFFPLIYCLLDGAGTFLDAIYLDKLELINEDAALIAYEYTFFIYGLISYIYLRFLKKEKMKIYEEKEKLMAAIFETLGQMFYVYAMAANSTLSAPVVASYSIMSVLLARLLLKEKLRMKEYVAICTVLLGIVILGVSEGLA